MKKGRGRKVEATLDGMMREGHSDIWNLIWDLKDERCQNQRENHLGEEKTRQNEEQNPWGMKKLGISQEIKRVILNFRIEG